jgi:hypothetical protein
MRPFKQTARVEVAVISGTVRVTVQPAPHWMLLLLQAGVIGMFAVLSFRARVTMSLIPRILSSLVVIAAIEEWLRQVFGSAEVIEFDSKHLRVRKETFGWERIREYPLEQCSDLTLQDESGSPHGLQCRLGRWKTIEFGDYLSQRQAIEVLSALQNGLPDVAHRILLSIDITKPFSRLNLS